MRIFASERVSNLMLKLGMEEGVPIEHRMVTKSIENAQKKVEGHNFDIRKHLLEYDDVMNKQREVIYQHRAMVMRTEDLSEEVQDMIGEFIDEQIDLYCPEEEYAEKWDVIGLVDTVRGQLGLDVVKTDELKEMGRDAIRDEIKERVRTAYKEKEERLQREQGVNAELFRYLEKMVLLQVIDQHWKDHLLGMDQLRDGIGLRGYGQKDPLAEYKREGYDMFAGMMDRIKADTLERLFKVQLVRGERPEPIRETPQISQMILGRGNDSGKPKTVHRPQEKVGRNEPCPCGSGKKYKKCHGA